jgi:hypothetical protein
MGDPRHSLVFHQKEDQEMTAEHKIMILIAWAGLIAFISLLMPGLGCMIVWGSGAFLLFAAVWKPYNTGPLRACVAIVLELAFTMAIIQFSYWLRYQAVLWP